MLVRGCAVARGPDLPCPHRPIGMGGAGLLEGNRRGARLQIAERNGQKHRAPDQDVSGMIVREMQLLSFGCADGRGRRTARFASFKQVDAGCMLCCCCDVEC